MIHIGWGLVINTRDLTKYFSKSLKSVQKYLKIKHPSWTLLFDSPKMETCFISIHHDSIKDRNGYMGTWEPLQGLVNDKAYLLCIAHNIPLGDGRIYEKIRDSRDDSSLLTDAVYQCRFGYIVFKSSCV